MCCRTLQNNIMVYTIGICKKDPEFSAASQNSVEIPVIAPEVMCNRSRYGAGSAGHGFVFHTALIGANRDSSIVPELDKFTLQPLSAA